MDERVLICSGSDTTASAKKAFAAMTAMGIAVTGRDIVGETINSAAKVKPRKERTEADLQRINAAKAKRERKAAKRLGK